MPATQICGGSRPSGLIRRSSDSNQIKGKCRPSLSLPREQACKFIASSGRKDANNEKGWNLSARHEKIFAPCVKHRRKPCFPFSGNQLSSDFEMETSKFEGRNVLDSSENRLPELTTVPNRQSVSFDVKRELLRLSIPAIAGQAIDPLAQLMETAYIGRLGSMELGSAGISVNIFNYISKLFNIPLLSVATSFVAEDISKYETKASASEKGDSSNGQPSDGLDERKQLPSVSTALTLAIGIGVFEAIALSLGSGIFLCLMGISLLSSLVLSIYDGQDSPMRIPAQRFLSLRALGAPAVVVSLALQGVFRGFKDTKTPVFCLGIGNLLAVLLFPMLMYYFRLGVTGAALSTVISQYTVTFLMLWFLNKRAILLPPKLGSLQFGGYIKSGGFLLGRTLAVLTTLTFGTSMAARQGPTAMAAHQICIQVWLAVSLLTDALGTSAQAMVASYISKGDYKIVREITGFTLKIGLLIGIALSVILGASFGSLATLFTNDADVLSIVRTGVLFVSASQPLNSLAYIFDGLHYGISDYAYAAQAMMIVGAISSLFLLYAPSVIGLHGVWFGLTLFMGLRMVAGYLRLQSKTGPWWFLHTE